jgi:adenine specific DNA methylase Mod
MYAYDYLASILVRIFDNENDYTLTILMCIR